MAKLFYTYWLRDVVRYFRIDRRGGEQLCLADLPMLDPAQATATCWAAAPTGAEPGRSLLLTLLLTVVRTELKLQVGWASMSLLLAYSGPFGMYVLLDEVARASTGSKLSGAMVLAGAAVALGPLAKAVADAQTFLNGWAMGTKLRAYLTRAICRKALVTDQAATGSWSIGEITNLLAVDINNILNFSPGGSWLVLEVVQLFTTLGILFYILGAAALGGVVVTLITVPVNGYVIRRIKKLQERLMAEKDARMALVSEAVTAIRTIKLHAWEQKFERRIGARRAREIQTLLHFQLLGAVTTTIVLCTPTLAALSCFVVKSELMKQKLAASEGFTGLTLFQLLSTSLQVIPSMINSAIQSRVGLQRIQRFLALPEVEGRADGDAPRGGALLVNASFKWQASASPDSDTGKSEEALANQKTTGLQPLLAAPSAAAAEAVGGDADAVGAAELPTLRGLNLRVTPGSLVVVCGPTGCGKSSLLAALLGDIPRVDGVCAVHGRVSYCPQRAWVSNDTLKANILFGTPFEQDRYDAVLDACALRPDLALLPAGDETEIGERGVNLSGGQQQRVNLARACYARSDVVLIDDALSAVDAHVGEHLFQQCILKLLAGRTRVLVTHAVPLALPSADHVVAMAVGGIVAAQGPPNGAADKIVGDVAAFAELRQRAASAGSEAEDSARSGSEADSARAAAGRARSGSEEPLIEPPSECGVVAVGEAGSRQQLQPASAVSVTSAAGFIPPDANVSAVSGASGGTIPLAAAATPAADGGDGKGDGERKGKLVSKEERARGTTSLSTYVCYLRAAGGLKFAFGFLCVCVLFAALNPVQSIMLKRWMDVMEGESTSVDDEASRVACLLYVGTAAAFILVTLLRNVLLPFAAVRASRTLHAGMTASILAAPVSWFQSTPLGRILNRFASDISAIDQTLAPQFKDTVVVALNVIAIAMVCVLGTGDLAAQLVVLGALLVTLVLVLGVFRLYRVSARELKRLESVTKSPMLAFFAEMVSGATVVRAFSEQGRFVGAAGEKVDDANRSLFYLWVTNQWLRVWMNSVGSVVTVACVVAVLWQAAELTGGDAGLSLSYASQFTAAVMWFFRIETQLEVTMNYVERIHEYTYDLPAEAYAGEEPPDDWPSRGAIAFERVTMKYASAAKAVFEDLSFDVPARTRVGIVGRTGAGKSSLAVALFRELELLGGRITIDGSDTKSLDLAGFRGRLSIIQQEPTLFRGSLRYNLAPDRADEPEGRGGGPPEALTVQSSLTDAEAWAVLKRTGLEGKVRSMPGMLDAELTEGGGNLSAGERQLVCMARALLRSSSILLMDEATASVDHQTDAAIQRMVRHELRGTATVLTVAHRLNTVVFYDKILVLGPGGVLLEYDTPLKLLQKEGGALRRLAEESGDFAALEALARGAADDRVDDLPTIPAVEPSSTVLSMPLTPGP